MSTRVDKGTDLDSSGVIQPNRTITEKNDGTLEGQVVYKCDAADVDSIIEIDDPHPDDSKLECYNISKTYNNNNICTVTASFFGLTSATTEPVVSYSGGQNNEPIETHPDFEEFASTYNAQFDSDGRFVTFPDADATDAPPFRGVEYYLTPSTMVTLSYWTDKVPRLNDRLTIHSKIPGVNGSDFKTPSDVTDWLLLDSPYRQVGNFYQVTEQYLGSGQKGWNEVIYTRKGGIS